MSSIKTFARVKPTDKPYDDFDTTLDRLYFRLSDGRENYGNQNKSKSGSNTVNHEFKFNSVFNAHTTQEEVFEKSAKEIVERKYVFRICLLIDWFTDFTVRVDVLKVRANFQYYKRNQIMIVLCRQYHLPLHQTSCFMQKLKWQFTFSVCYKISVLSTDQCKF